MSASRTVLLADASVVIDYRDSDLGVLGLVAQHVGRVAVLTQVLEEVRGVTAARCRRLGVEVVELETDAMVEAAKIASSVSFNDRLCLVACRKRGWTCVSNDRAPQRLCAQYGVEISYGLGLMVELVTAGALRRRRALAIARQIQAANPLHINQRVFARFLAALREGT